MFNHLWISETIRDGGGKWEWESKRECEISTSHVWYYSSAERQTVSKVSQKVQKHCTTFNCHDLMLTVILILNKSHFHREYCIRNKHKKWLQKKKYFFDHINWQNSLHKINYVLYISTLSIHRRILNKMNCGFHKNT